jgi:hypothetical protein
VRKIGVKSVKRLIRDEKGQAMAMVLFLILVGGLIVGSLLSYVGTGLFNGRVYERRTAELYAADAGVEDAVWKIQHGEVALCPGDPTHSYDIADVNGKSVEVTITSVYGVGNVTLTYHVISTATGNSSATQVDAYIAGETKYGDYSGITENVITSQNEIIIKPGSNVSPPAGEEHGPAANYTGDWPPPEVLCDWYFEDVKDETPYGSATLDVKNYSATGIGPFYRNGMLTIKNTGTAGLTLQLNGTVYITGDTLIGTTDKDFTLDLNGYTIFVASNSTKAYNGKYALEIGGKCTMVGEGAIIAIGDIYFAPKTESGVTDPVFIMSIVGKSLVQPNGDFYGSIAGSVEVDLWPGTSVNYPAEGFGLLNFPGCTAGRYIYGIATWEVTQL